jgi:diguanylate cyclase (GGDEF)-like protein
MLQDFLQFARLPGTIIAVSAVAFVVVGIIWRIRVDQSIRRMADRIQSLEKERDNLALWVEDAKQREYIDEKTGIPNEKKMEEDFFLFCREVEVSKIDKFCITQVDLENFDRVNEMTSSRKGDIAIRIFARTVYRSMRRNEFMFRLDSDVRSKGQYDGVFRRQIGGDEFIFLTRGSANFALGFIQRLLKDMPKYSDEISQKLSLQERINLNLRAGIVEIGMKEVKETRTLEDVRRYIDMAERRCYKAKNLENNLRVFWPGVVEQEHSSEVSQNAAELTLIHILAQLRQIESERKFLETRADPDKPQHEDVKKLLGRISGLKMDARYLLEFMYKPILLDKQDDDYIHDVRNT